MIDTIIDYFNSTEGLVRGYRYIAEFFNGAQFNFWAGRKLNRKEAKQAALMMANGDYNPPIYDIKDIVWVRKCK
jgi:hypothetical protein